MLESRRAEESGIKMEAIRVFFEDHDLHWKSLGKVGHLQVGEGTPGQMQVATLWRDAGAEEGADWDSASHVLAHLNGDRRMEFLGGRVPESSLEVQYVLLVTTGEGFSASSWPHVRAERRSGGRTYVLFARRCDELSRPEVVRAWLEMDEAVAIRVCEGRAEEVPEVLRVLLCESWTPVLVALAILAQGFLVAHAVEGRKRFEPMLNSGRDEHVLRALQEMGCSDVERDGEAGEWTGGKARMDERVVEVAMSKPLPSETAGGGREWFTVVAGKEVRSRCKNEWMEGMGWESVEELLEAIGKSTVTASVVAKAYLALSKRLKIS